VEKESRTPIPGARDIGTAFGGAIKVDYKALLDKARAIDTPEGLGELREIVSRLERRLPDIDDEFPSKWQAAGEKKWTSDAIAELKAKIQKFESELESPISVMEIPPEVLAPEIPEGLGEGWYRMVPCEGGRLEVFARALDEGETRALDNALFSKEQGRRKPATYFELALTLDSKRPLTLKGRDYFGVKIHENIIYRIRPRNNNYHEQAIKVLGPSHKTTQELDIEEFSLEPLKRVKKLLAFDEGQFDKPLDLMMINKFLCGEWPLHRTTPMLYPPGFELPAETVLQLVLPRKTPPPGAPKEVPDPWADRKKDWGAVDGGSIVSEGVEVGLRLPPKDELVQFYSDEPVFVPDAVGIAFVKATCNVPGQKGLIDAEAITNVFRGGASGITNVLPSWDPRGGPPDLPAPRQPVVLWRHVMKEREPKLAVSGDRTLVTTDDRDLEVLDADGNVAFTFSTRGRVSAIAGCQEGFLVACSEELTLIGRDGQYKFKVEHEDGVKSLSELPDGTILAGSDPYYKGTLSVFDPEGKPVGKVDVQFTNHITQMPDGRILAVDGRGRPGIIEAGGDIKLSAINSGVRNLSMSADGKRIFLLEDRQMVSCLSVDRTRAATKNEVGTPDLPDVPLLVQLWERRITDSPVCMAHVRELGALASAIRLGFLYVHSEDGSILWKGRFKGDSISALAAIPGSGKLLVATEEPALYCLDLAPALK
jgi:hypothetical protein